MLFADPQAIVAELTKLGASVEEGHDFCVITPPKEVRPFGLSRPALLHWNSLIDCGPSALHGHVDPRLHGHVAARMRLRGAAPMPAALHAAAHLLHIQIICLLTCLQLPLI